MSNSVALRPAYWASVSGGKDSLYMLNLILHNLDKYPLDGVYHLELEIDFPFIKNVIDYMEFECKRFNIPFVRLKPERTWEEWYYDKITSKKTGEKVTRGFPTRKARWCNAYKTSAQKQLNEWMKSLGFYTVSYIGYCADEESRYVNRKNAYRTERYPLVEEGILEDTIHEWAKTEPIFNHYYETQRRCGCMYCPMSRKMEFAYLYKYYPDNFNYMIDKMRETENQRERELGIPFSVTSSNAKYNSGYLENIIKTKWLQRLEDEEQKYAIQTT